MAVLNNAYGAAREGLGFDAAQLASQVSGASGIRRTSSPVAASVSSYMLPQYAALRQQQAQQQLGLGLENRNFGENQRRYNQQWRLGLTNTQPTSLTNLANYYAGLQFAQPTQRSNATYGSQTHSMSTPSPFQAGMGIGGMLMPMFTGGLGLGMGALSSGMGMAPSGMTGAGLAGANLNAGIQGIPSAMRLLGNPAAYGPGG
jgi:hypothetical protein